jgi:NAD+ synthase (glutamine-hydrolysing)
MIITAAQLNPIVGDIRGNLSMVKEVISKRKGEPVDLFVFSELFLTGYPPRDLLERKWFLKANRKALEEIISLSKRIPESGIIVGTTYPTKRHTGKGIYNSAVLIFRGAVLHHQPKSLLPTYDVFDEGRYFDPGESVHTVAFKDEVLGLSVCEDAWSTPEFFPDARYPFDPIEELARGGASILINISASPFHAGKEELRYDLACRHSHKYGVPFLLLNQVGGNDELVFDGSSVFTDRNGAPVEVFPAFEEAVKTFDTAGEGAPERVTPKDRMESVYHALVLGTRDYVRKCGFSRVILGLSGGIDSALTCCIACDAVGKDNVHAISMPSMYSSPGSVGDSGKLARNLGIRMETIPITSVYRSYARSLHRVFGGKVEGITAENIQARIRGNILMAYSNRDGYLVLSTGNKSELAVGYCTLYGDMSGGLGVLVDIPKTMVYELSQYVNRDREIIPREIMEKPPSAELKPGQTDQDTLPPYEVLDGILDLYLDRGWSVKEIVREGFERETVRWVVNSVNRNEYKRRQAAPGLKVTSKSFGTGRRMPIAARYGDE